MKTNKEKLIELLVNDLDESKIESLLKSVNNITISIDGKELSKIINKNKSISYSDIKTYEDAVNVMPVSLENILYYTDCKYIRALKKLSHIYSAINYLNNNWKPNWLDTSQYKYYPYFKAESNYKSSGASGFGFSFSYYHYDIWVSGVGSRLCTYSSEVAEYIGKQFEDLYNDYLN